MSYLDRLKEHLSEKHPIGQPLKPPEPSLSGSSGSPGGRISLSEALRLCDRGLASLDPAKPLHGLDAGRWRQLLDDAQWLRDSFGLVAVRHGWTVGELFGLWWLPEVTGAGYTKDGWGGIADRLQGARSLVMDESRAHWRRMFSGEPDQFNRTAYPDLRPLWEAPE